MANDLTEYLKGREPRGFRLHPFYSREGDFLNYFFKNEDHYAERIDEFLTVYHSMEGDEFVGFKLKGVVHLLETVGDLRLKVYEDDGLLVLSILLIAGSMKTTDPSAHRYYQKAAWQTTNVRMRKEELQLA